jgi:hypothetical protein
MEKLLDILIPVAIVLFIVGGKLFSLLKEKGFDFGNLLQQDEDSAPDAGSITRKAANDRDYNEDEWGDETIVVPPPPALPAQKSHVMPASMEAAKTANPAKTAVKSAPLFPELTSWDNDEFHSSHHSRGAYYSGYIHAHGKSAIVIHEILSKPKGLE